MPKIGCFLFWESLFLERWGRVFVDSSRGPLILGDPAFIHIFASDNIHRACRGLSRLHCSSSLRAAVGRRHPQGSCALFTTLPVGLSYQSSPPTYCAGARSLKNTGRRASYEYPNTYRPEPKRPTLGKAAGAALGSVSRETDLTRTFSARLSSHPRSTRSSTSSPTVISSMADSKSST